MKVEEAVREEEKPGEREERLEEERIKINWLFDLEAMRSPVYLPRILI